MGPFAGFGGRKPRYRRGEGAPGPARERPPARPGKRDANVFASMVAEPAAERAAAAPATRRPRLVDLAAPVFAMIHAIRHAPQAPDAAAVRRAWLRQREAFTKRAQDAGLRNADLEAAVYALCAFLDESMLNHAESRDAWLTDGALQLEFHGELLAGQRFFDRLDDLRRARESDLEALAFYQTCLAMGFRGRYFADEEGLNRLMAEIARDIDAVRGGAPGPIAPNAARKDERAGVVLERFPVWVVPTLLAAALLLSYLTVLIVSNVSSGSAAGRIAGY